MRKLNLMLLAGTFCAMCLGTHAQWPSTTGSAPHWKDKYVLGKYVLAQDVAITSGITLLNAAGTATQGYLTQAELVTLANSAASSTELGYITGVTAGTSAASKAVVLDASKQINEMDVTTTFALNGTAITPTAAQINLLVQGTSAGKKITGGQADVTTSATIASGLSTLTAAVATLGVAPDANTNSVYAETSGTNVILYTYKATGVSTTTLIPSTTATAIHWIAFGT